jgi:hypothetical protein
LKLRLSPTRSHHSVSRSFTETVPVLFESTELFRLC